MKARDEQTFFLILSFSPFLHLNIPSLFLVDMTLYGQQGRSERKVGMAHSRHDDRELGYLWISVDDEGTFTLSLFLQTSFFLPLIARESGAKRAVLPDLMKKSATK